MPENNQSRMSNHFATITGILLVCLVALAACTPATHQLQPTKTEPELSTKSTARFTSFDLFTPSSAKSQKFYGEVFGWSFNPTQENDQFSIYHKGQNIGHVIQHDVENDKLEPARWISNLSVPNLKETIEQIAKYGGEITAGPEQDPFRGLIVLIQDREGAEVLLSEAQDEHPGNSVPIVGDFVWVDLFTRSQSDVGDFYENIASFDIIAEPGSSEHFYFITDKKIRAGLVVHDWKDVESNWLPYVGVEDITKTVLKVFEAGGDLLIKSGKSAVVVDATGAAIGIHEVDDGGSK